MSGLATPGILLQGIFFNLVSDEKYLGGVIPKTTTPSPSPTVPFGKQTITLGKRGRF